jgi:hypothetical protein
VIRARGTTADGRPVILLGLSEGNLTRLRQGQPINASLEVVGLRAQVVILYGETEDDIRRELVEAGITFEREDDARPKSKRG